MVEVSGSKRVELGWRPLRRIRRACEQEELFLELNRPAGFVGGCV
jgi:hypothetical protein